MLPAEVVEVDRELALGAAEIKAGYPIPYAGCFTLALAKRVGGMVVTGDPEFKRTADLVPLLLASGKATVNHTRAVYGRDPGWIFSLEVAKHLPGHITRVRDLILWETGAPATLVIASDNLGGIGSLRQDKYSCPPEDVGYFTARVVLFELLAAGALPRLLLFNLANGGDYARLILQGVRDALLDADLPGDFPVNGSSEKNVATEMTALGLTLIGMRDDNFRPGRARAGDQLWLVGRPKSAPRDRVVRGDPEMCGFNHLHFLSRQPGVHDMVPAGSGGARPEIDDLARRSRLQAVIGRGFDELVARSGGPATALVAAVAPEAAPVLVNLGASLPVQRVGALAGV